MKKYLPRIFHLGFTVPDDTIHFDEEKDEWVYQQPDWEAFKQIVKGNGPRSAHRLNLRETSYEETKWVRDAIMSYGRHVG